jgi:hypothetical protein
MNASNSTGISTRISIIARMVPTRAAALGIAVACALLVGFAQSASAATKLRGARDISGMWAAYPFSFFFDSSRKPGEPQKVMLQPEYDAVYQAREAAKAKNEAEGKPQIDRLTRCLPMGMPGSMGAFFGMEILATKKTVYVLSVGTDPMRRIFLDGRSIPPLDDLNPTYEGLSVGRWEGNTLVVDTAGLKTNTDLENVPHSDALRINERIRLLDDDTLEDVLTITDPKAFKAPWVITKQYKDYDPRSKNPGTYPNHKGAELEPTELVCNENNRNPIDASGAVGYELGK